LKWFTVSDREVLPRHRGLAQGLALNVVDAGGAARTPPLDC